jgi:hypothetical protein
MIAILRAHQPVKYEPTVGFLTLEEDTSCKEVGGLIIPGIQGKGVATYIDGM